uniref:Pericentriolar material 1 protein C-terminal domain-containing protein n=1 Tax=Electrophorus electricus TaxID=8005 RepID=A0A4W4HG51_ELEEL
MATGGAPFDDTADEQELQNWTITNSSLDDRLNNMDWGMQQKKPNRSSEKNRKKLSAMSESRLTNDISPESTPGAGRRRGRTPHSFPHLKYTTQMSVPDQAELDRLRQRINFADLDERSIGSDSHGRVTAANNQRQLSSDAKKPFNLLPLHVNTNKSKEPFGPASAASTPGTRETKKQSPAKDLFVPVPAGSAKELYGLDRAFGPPADQGGAEATIDSSQVVSKLVQIREYISKASSMRDDLLEKNDVPANVERLSHLIAHLKEQEKSYLRFLQKMLVPVGQKEELENLRKQHDLLQKMLQQQEQLRALQGRQAALLAMAAVDDTVVTETTGSVSGISITSELNDELNDLIRRFHNQLHDSQSQPVPDNRRQAESLSLSREVSRSRTTHNPRGLSAAAAASPAGVKLTKLQELQDKKQTMDKILQELQSLRDQTLNNSSCILFVCVCACTGRGASRRGACAMVREASGACAARPDPPSSCDDAGHPADKLRKLKEVHKRLNELRELVQYYEQTSDMMVDAVNVNEHEDEETEDGSLFEAMFDSEQENREPVRNIRNPAQPQAAGSWMDMNTLTNTCSGSNNRDGRLNSEREINNRCVANLRSRNASSAVECQYNRDGPYPVAKDGNDDDEGLEEEEAGRRGRGDSSVSGSSPRCSIAEDAEFAQKVHRLHTAKQKLRQLQELVAMVQSDDTDATAANEDEGLQQPPNNARETAPKAKRELSLSDKAREKLYEERLRQQQEELKQLHEERRRLMEIQDKIQDLHSASADSALLKPTTEPTPIAVTDNELWSEMRRHQVLREELRQRRKHLESLMAEQQRRSTLTDTPYRADIHTACSFNRDDRTMATWGGSTQCPLGGDDDDDDDSPSELGAEEEEEAEDEGEETTSGDEVHAYPTRKYPVASNRKNTDGYSCLYARNHILTPPNPPSHHQPGERERVPPGGGARRQENLRWPADLSASEGPAHTTWQEQVTQLQKQLDFSTAMCQTLLQDQQTLSCMLQSVLTGPYNMLPSNLGAPQVPLIMFQLNQCYTQLAWQQNNVHRHARVLKQVLNELLRQQQLAGQQQQSSSSSRQQEHQKVAEDSVSSSLFLPFPALNTLGMPGITNFSPLSAGACVQQSSPNPPQPPLHDPNMSLKTEYMSFPPPIQRTPLNNTDQRWLNSSLNRACNQQVGGAESDRGSESRPDSPTSSPACRPPSYVPDSHDSLSSLPDRNDPTTITKVFRPGQKASAQASLAARDKTPKSRRRRGRGHKNTGLESDSLSSAPEVAMERGRQRPSQARHRETNQSLLDKLTQEKLDSKTKNSNLNDISSAYAWRTPFLSNRIACTEAPDASSDFSLFEALRETIYSEVATLISQNESRPHFLIELFHELQLLNTDYLRQRALYSLQDIVTRHLTEKSVAEDQGLSLGPAVWAAGSQSELTPSESLATSDNDVSEKDVRVKTSSGQKRAGDGDSVDDESLMSTSSNLEPFASDDLGNTVIHLDKALARMREFERMKLKAEHAAGPPVCNAELSTAAAPPALSQGTAAFSFHRPECTLLLTHSAHRSSMDVRCPQIDTQQLDRQIKSIMTEVIPFLKEHMGEVCSPQLLTAVRRMVLTLTQQNDDSKEFMRFFHRQLGGILQDSLSKFAGRTLQDCGEDLLVEISEILFNELAFFRLMQDIDQNTHRAKKRSDITVAAHVPATEVPPHGGGGAGGVGAVRVCCCRPTNPLPIPTCLHCFDFSSHCVQHTLSLSFSDPVGRSTKSESIEVVESPEEEQEVAGAEKENAENSTVPDALLGPDAPATQESPQGSATASPHTDSPVMVNADDVGSGNTSQKSDEEDFVKVENLPLQLSVMCEEELCKQISAEQRNNNLTVEILNRNVDDGLSDLVGSAHALKEPEAIGAQSA